MGRTFGDACKTNQLAVSIAQHISAPHQLQPLHCLMECSLPVGLHETQNIYASFVHGAIVGGAIELQLQRNPVGKLFNSKLLAQQAKCDESI